MTVDQKINKLLLDSCTTLIDVLYEELLHSSIDGCRGCGNQRNPFPKNDIPKVIRKRITNGRNPAEHNLHDEVDLAFMLKRDHVFLDRCQRVIDILRVRRYRVCDLKRRTILTQSMLDLLMSVESYS
tara:strand:+ start:674 stop:1054 length:381 start_codon:yes stop_codon:yes gene_type:complete